MTCWWVAPTNQVADLAWERFKIYLNGAWTHKSEVKKFINLPNGSSIWCKSAETPDNLRGEGVDDLTLDEAAHIKNLSYVWGGVLRPMLVDSMGSMMALSTPNRRNLFYQWYLRGQDDNEPDWMSWNFPTTENPYLPPSEFEGLLQEYPPGSELYRQEILGEFLESGGAVFRKVREAATARRGTEPQKNHKYAVGVDWGKAHDFTVAFVLDATERRAVDVDRFNIVDYTVQRNRIKALCERWGVSYGEVELNSIGDPNYEMLIRDGLHYLRGFTTTASSKPPLIEALAQAFELGEIAIFDDPLLIGELESYERAVSANTGRPTYSAPSGMHDDYVIALALAWRAATIGAPELAAQPEQPTRWDVDRVQGVSEGSRWRRF